MEVSKKHRRWVALMLVWVLVIASLPDSFIAAMRIQAATLQDTTLMFTWQNEDNCQYGQDFEFYLYEKKSDNELIQIEPDEVVEMTGTDSEQSSTDGEQSSTDGEQSSTDGEQSSTDGEQSPTNGRAKVLSDDNPDMSSSGIKIQITKFVNKAEVKLSGLDSSKKYVYELRDVTSGTDKKLVPVFQTLNFSDVQPIVLKTTSQRQNIFLYLALNDTFKVDNLEVGYKIYPVLVEEGITGEGTEALGNLLAEGTTTVSGQIDSAVDLVEVTNLDPYSKYAVKFTGENIADTNIAYAIAVDGMQNAYTIGTEDAPYLLTAEDATAPVITCLKDQGEAFKNEADTQNIIYTYGESATRTFTIEEDNFKDLDGNPTVTVNVTKNSEAASADQVEWQPVEETTNKYQGSLTLTEEQGTTVTYTIEITCTDQYGSAGNYKETVVIDKTAPQLSIEDITSENVPEYTDDESGITYYGGSTTFKISVIENDSLDEKEFRKAIVKGITVKNSNNTDATEVLTEKYKTNILNELESTGTDSAYTVKAGETELYTISAWSADEKGYEVTFKGNFFYGINISYADKCNNTGSLVASDFVIDTTVPTAEPKIQSRRYEDASDLYTSTTENGVGLRYTTNCTSIESTFLPSKFVLTNITDGNGSGVESVKYINSSVPMIEEELIKDLVQWVDLQRTDNSGEINITEANNDGNYYVYYKITDNVGNITYLNGLGFELDNTAPTIEYSYGESTKPVMSSTTDGIKTSVFSSDVNLSIALKDKNLDTEKTTLEITRNGNDYQKEIIEGSATSIQLVQEENKTVTYEVTVTCSDKAGIPASHTEKFVIDTEGPTATTSVKTQKYDDDEVHEYVENKEYISTCQNGRTSSFLLKDVSDNVSGVESVEYDISNEKLDQEAVKGGTASLNWTKLPDNADNGEVSLSKDDASGNYYIYYKLTDKAGNTSYLCDNPAIKLDNTAPVIKPYTYTKEKKIADEDDKKYTFSEDVEVGFEIVEDNFSAAHAVIEVIKDGDNENKTEYKDWTGKTYSKQLSCQEGTCTVYQITTTFTDDAGIPAEDHTETVVIDKKAPIITVKYGTETETAGYYKSRTATISIEEDSLDSVAFENAISEGITVTDRNPVSNEKAYTISKWDGEKSAYTVTFSADANYDIGGIKYEDKCGKFNDVVKYENSGDDSTPATFSIDKTAPTAGFALQLLNYGDAEYNQGYANEKTSWTPEEFLERNPAVKYFSTCFETTDGEKRNTNFVLHTIDDNLSGINQVYYYLKSGTPLEAGKELSEIEARNWELGTIETDQETGKGTLTVSLEGKTTDHYYIYYKLVDNAGNAAYYNGVGITLDMDNPVIDPFGYSLDASVENAESSTYTFNDNVTLTCNVTEQNFISGNYGTVTVKKNGTLIEIPEGALTWEYNQEKNQATGTLTFTEGTALWTENGKCDKYEITVTSKDVVNRETEYSETVIVDRKAPVINYSGKGDTHPYYAGEKTFEISVEEDSLDKGAFETAIGNGITISDITGKTSENKNDMYYSIEPQNDTNNTYLITFKLDAIYTLNFSYTDKCGYSSSEIKDSFVIDSTAPKIMVTYDDTNKVKDHYYKAGRIAEITVEDLGFAYAKKIDDTKIGWTIAAEDDRGTSVGNAYSEDEEWSFHETSGTYQKKISFIKDAIYDFNIVSAKDMCENQTVVQSIDYGMDGQSFVIDTTAPEIMVVYKDTADNKVKDHYYKAARTAVISVEDLSYTYANRVEGIQWKTMRTDISQEVTEVTENSGDLEWSFANGVFSHEIIHNDLNAIYNFGITAGTDLCTNTITQEQNVHYHSNEKENIADGQSFVIDAGAPVVEISFDDQNKKALHYYSGERKAKVEVTDLSYIYENIVEKKSEYAAKDRIVWNISATDLDNRDISASAVSQEDWMLDEETWKYQRTVTFEKDAIYEFAVSGKDICGTEAVVSYGETQDAQSFVIDSAAPQITVTYGDENKSSEHYYTGDRTAVVQVRDLSYIYENTVEKKDAEPIVQAAEGRTTWTIRVTDEKGALIADHASGQAEAWSYDAEKRTYQTTIRFTGDAIYAFEVSGSDICQNNSKAEDINYQAADGNSFVIDSTAPQIKVTYEDTYKSSPHYYTGERKAVLTVSDLSYTYENTVLNQSKKPAAEGRIIWRNPTETLPIATDETGAEAAQAYTAGDWTFNKAAGEYQCTITFSKDAIYGFMVEGQDICSNESQNADIVYEAEDANSFVIDRAAPEVLVIYDDNDKNKLQDHYYKDNRTAELIVSDLSYVYEDQNRVAGILTPEERIQIITRTQNEEGQPVENAYEETGWTFGQDGKYHKTITFQADAVYSYEMSGTDIYARAAAISYVWYEGEEQEAVADYDSFVIDRNTPEITVVYDDSNKLEDHYYQGVRTAEITVSDLSYVYEDIRSEDASDVETVSARVNLKVETSDSAGKTVSDAYEDTLWSFGEDGKYHRTVTFEKEAIYAWEMSGNDIYKRTAEITYQNKNEEAVADYDSFVIDNTAPQITVVYNDKNKVTDEAVNNHFYKGERTAKILISDLSYVYEDQRRRLESPSDGKITPELEERISLSVKGQDISLNELGEGSAETQSDWTLNGDGIYVRDIAFANDAIYSFGMSGGDIYGRAAEIQYTNGSNEISDYASFVVDTKNPEVTVTYDDSKKGLYAGYYNGTRRAEVTLKDLSFVYADKVLPFLDSEDTSKELLEEQLFLNQNAENYIKAAIGIKDDDNNKNLENTDNSVYEISSWKQSGDDYKKAYTFKGEAHYTFQMQGHDICTNEVTADYSGVADAKEFWIDLTDPTISITYDDNTPTRVIDGRGYFKKTRTATIVITEGISTFADKQDASDVTKGIQITAKDASGTVTGAGYTIGSWESVPAYKNNSGVTTHTVRIAYLGDANYDFDISYTDKAGRTAQGINTNAGTTPYSFSVDKTAPAGSVTVGNLGTWNMLVSNRTFGLWSSKAADISAAWQDAVSSVYSVKYYKTPAVDALTVAQLDSLSNSQWTDYNPFTVRPDEQFTVYLRIEDRSGNVTYISSDGIILDTTAPEVESVAPEITVTPVQPVNDIYNTDVTVGISVSDPMVNGAYSGLKTISYQVLNMGTVTQEGELYSFVYAGGRPLQSQLLRNWSGQIVVDRSLNNSNDVQIIVYAQDNSGNAASGSNAVKIDITQPAIDISYDNNSGDTSFGEMTYFKEDRTATIRVTERNFNAEQVIASITNTDGVIPTISGWSYSAGTGNGDDSVYTATISYTADGDYSFDITGTDLAGNGNTAADYGTSLAPQSFTLDKTLPVINVAYDNNSARNNNYYSAARTATITINEHNFETGRYVITTTASDDGAVKTAPSISGWSTNGDIHTATVQFADDGYYTIGMSYTDMAGNQAADFAEQNFYVDKTMPFVTLKGIQNLSANNGDVIGFELTCMDTNFDVFEPVFTVTRLIDGKNVAETYNFDSRVEIKNGVTYIIKNIPTDGIYSLVCTIYDRAGNAFNKIIYLDENGQELSSLDVADESAKLLEFSVNREGSAYVLDEYTNTVGTEYYVTEVSEDLVIFETNVDDLNEYVIELNGEVLKEGTDYTVEKSGGGGEWYVKKYIIKKSLFEAEGEYKIVVYSVDKANNTAYSDIKGTNVSFVVDKTAPEITVSGVEDNGRYQVESQNVTVIPKDDGGKLKSLKVEILDSEDREVDGYPVSWAEEALTQALEENDGTVTFAIPQGTNMSVRILCEDMAGNSMDILTFDHIIVSTSGFTIFLANKPLFYGTIGGIAAVVTGGIVVIVWKKKKKKEAKQQ